MALEGITPPLLGLLRLLSSHRSVMFSQDELNVSDREPVLLLNSIALFAVGLKDHLTSHNLMDVLEEFRSLIDCRYYYHELASGGSVMRRDYLQFRINVHQENINLRK